MGTDLSRGEGRVLRAAGWAIGRGAHRRERVPGREAVGAALGETRVERGEYDVVALVAQLGVRGQAARKQKLESVTNPF
jgi:hypothetical protein